VLVQIDVLTPERAAANRVGRFTVFFFVSGSQRQLVEEEAHNTLTAQKQSEHSTACPPQVSCQLSNALPASSFSASTIASLVYIFGQYDQIDLFFFRSFKKSVCDRKNLGWHKRKLRRQRLLEAKYSRTYIWFFFACQTLLKFSTCYYQLERRGLFLRHCG